MSSAVSIPSRVWTRPLSPTWTRPSDVLRQLRLADLPDSQDGDDPMTHEETFDVAAMALPLDHGSLMLENRASAASSSSFTLERWRWSS